MGDVLAHCITIQIDRAKKMPESQATEERSDILSIVTFITDMLNIR